MKLVPFLFLILFFAAVSYFATRQIKKYKDETDCKHELADKMNSDLTERLNIKNNYEKKIKHYRDLKDIYNTSKDLIDNTLNLVYK